MYIYTYISHWVRERVGVRCMGSHMWVWEKTSGAKSCQHGTSKKSTSQRIFPVNRALRTTDLECVFYLYKHSIHSVEFTWSSYMYFFFSHTEFNDISLHWQKYKCSCITCIICLRLHIFIYIYIPHTHMYTYMYIYVYMCMYTYT